MGSVAFAAAQDESQPSTSNCKSSTMILDGCGAVNHASIPKKLRSAIKKRGRESIASPLLISRKQHRLSTAVDTPRKDGAKKSKLNKKQGCITKEEEEVAETLYALAGMFSDAKKADQQEINNEKTEIKSSAALEEADTCPTLRDENRKMSSKVTLGAVCPSNVVNSTAEEVISQTLEAPQPELFLSSKQMASPNASRGQSDLNQGSTSRPLVSILGKHEIHSDQVAASRFQYGSCSFIGEKCKDLFPSPNNVPATSSEMHKSCMGRLFEGTIFSSQPRVVESNFSTEKYTGVGAESSKSWKRCSAHVYISRLIKVLQISDRPVEPTQPAATCQGAELQSRVSFDNQMLRTNVSNGDTCFGATDIVAAKKHSSETRGQQMASETSAKQGYDFLSLGMGTGTGLRGLDTGESANGAGCFLKRPQQYHMPYAQSQSQSTGLRPLPRNGYSSSPAAQQVQLSRYHSSDLTGKTGQQQMESQQQKWAAQLQMHYYTGGGGGPRVPNWRNGGVVNYAHSSFPHLHASMYQQLTPLQQHQVMITNVPPLPTKRRHTLPLGFDRNRGVFGPENMAQLQLP